MEHEYYLVRIIEKNGEQEYNVPYTISITPGNSIEEAINKVIENWYPFGSPLGISVELSTYHQLTREEYKVLSRYI